MNTEEILKKIKNEVVKDISNYDDQITAIAKFIESEFKPKNSNIKREVTYVRSNEINDIFSFKFDVEETDYIEFPRTMGMNEKLVTEYLN